MFTLLTAFATGDKWDFHGDPFEWRMGTTQGAGCIHGDAP